MIAAERHVAGVKAFHLKAAAPAALERRGLLTTWNTLPIKGKQSGPTTFDEP
jgi:hypothetical protein